MDLEGLIEKVADRLQTTRARVVVAESCTGGRVASALTSMPGSSAWFDRGFVAYSNAAKVQMLGVKEATLFAFGAVSCETVLEMAYGALERSGAIVSLAASGIAGPEGGTPEKPLGTVWIACATRDDSRALEHHFEGERDEIQEQTVAAALEMLLAVEIDQGSQ